MASAGSESTIGDNEQLEHVIDKGDICDNILSTHRSMPDRTVSLHATRTLYITLNVDYTSFAVFFICTN